MGEGTGGIAVDGEPLTPLVGQIAQVNDLQKARIASKDV